MLLGKGREWSITENLLFRESINAMHVILFFITYRNKQTLQQDPAHRHTQLNQTFHRIFTFTLWGLRYFYFIICFSSILFKNAGHDPLNWSYVSLLGLKISLQWWGMRVLDSEYSVALSLTGVMLVQSSNIVSLTALSTEATDHITGWSWEWNERMNGKHLPQCLAQRKFSGKSH